MNQTKDQQSQGEVHAREDDQAAPPDRAGEDQENQSSSQDEREEQVQDPSETPDREEDNQPFAPGRAGGDEGDQPVSTDEGGPDTGDQSASPAEGTAETEPILKIKRVSKTFGDLTAVDEAEFDVPRGTIFGLIGPSGAGKTTLIRMLTGVYQSDRGELEVLGGSPVDFGADEKLQIGYMPQHFVLYPRLTVMENLHFVASMYGMGFGRGSRIREVLDFVELTPHRGKLARELSGGMQRRLGMSAALLHTPELVFLDEPSAGIDPVLRDKIWEGLYELRDQGQTLFVTTQYVSEAANCDLVAVLSEGKVVTVGSPEELRREAFGGEMLTVELSQPLDPETYDQLHDQGLVQQEIITYESTRLRLVVEDAKSSIPELMDWFSERGTKVESIDVVHPPFDDVFVELIENHEERGHV